ncbi:hypothetical protein LTR35_009424 [Friedmanniomyces endolithicus]|nr:hypothetical protein LTR35_009424 [Friedmanniomyces endolithicus]KAK0290766.1 hypothetical protein LTS00_008542 [Friedmanniomyces endolithicus]KAK0997859.1 hypothetical protein LTR54_009656 [Friedmanniomyces endolithicus]
MVALSHLVRAASTLTVVLYNAVPSTEVKAYLTAHEPNGAIRMLSEDGTWFDPCSTRSGAAGTQPLPAATITHHLGAQGSYFGLEIPVPVTSGRMYFVTDGELEFGTTGPSAGGVCPLQEPSALNMGEASAHRSWGFMEFSYRNELLFVNPTLVDFVGTPLSVRMETPDGNLDARGLPTNAVDLICHGLAAKAKDEHGIPWHKLCVHRQDGSPLRVLSPSHYKEADIPILDRYWEEHVDAVWNAYRSKPLKVNTQGDHGVVPCQVHGDVLVCDSESFAKPCSTDVFGCDSGPFANEGSPLRRALASRLCAAFHRTTLLGADGDKQPAVGVERYYTTSPSNWYSKLVHEHAIDGNGYAFRTMISQRRERRTVAVRSRMRIRGSLSLEWAGHCRVEEEMVESR